MRTHALRLSAVVLSLAFFSSALRSNAPAGEPGEKRFIPAEHFPAPAVLYFSIGSVARLKEQFAGTLLGRIATDPGAKRAFSGLLAKLEEGLAQESGPFVEATGKTPLEVLGLLRGEVAFALKGLGAGGSPEAALAIELGEGREGILGLVQRLRSKAEEAEGGALEEQEIDGIRVTSWPAPAGKLLEAVLGTHIVLATSPELMQSIAAAFQKEPGGGAPAGERFLEPGAARKLAVEGREVLVALNLDVIQAMTAGLIAASPDAGTVRKVLHLIGVDRLTSLGYALGFRDGALEGALHLGMRDGAGGALEILRGAFSPLEDPGEALALVPAAAFELEAARLEPGKALRQLDSLLRDAFPGLAEGIEGAYRQLEEGAGISMEKDVFGLGEIALYAFQVMPPAGGIFADQVLLVRTEAFASYWSLVKKLGAALGAEAQVLDSQDGKVEYVNLLSAAAKEIGFFQRILRGEGIGELDLTEVLVLALSLTSAVFSRSDIPGGWTAVSTSPQAVIRYVEHHAKGPKLSGDAPMAALAKARLTGASTAAVFRGGVAILAAYNSVLSLASMFSSLASMAGIDLAQLPPAERFLGAVRPGYIRVELEPAGFTVRGHRALESTSGVLLAGVGVASIGAGFLVPTLLSGRGEALKVQCASNLRQLYGLALAYSDEAGNHAFPYSADGSLAALQMLIDRDPEVVQPDLFVCAEGKAKPPRVEDGKVLLTGDTCSYEIVPWRLKNTTADAILLYDKAPHHSGKRNVCFTDGSINAMGEAEFQERLAKERERFGGGKKAEKSPGEKDK